MSTESNLRRFTENLSLPDEVEFAVTSSSCESCGGIVKKYSRGYGWWWYECRCCGYRCSVSWAEVGVSQSCTVEAASNETFLRQLLGKIAGRKVMDGLGTRESKAIRARSSSINRTKSST